MLVKLIPTGRAELLGLAACLQPIFPTHTFECVRGGVDEQDRPLPFDSFTSSRIKAPDKPGTVLGRLVQQLASEVCPGRAGKPADLAILIDDLELANADQPGIVIEAVRNAVKQHLKTLSSSKMAERVEQALLQKASFHLAVPMIEAWFFADIEVLPRAGVPAERLPPRLREDIDPEQFECDDSIFENDPGSQCTKLAERNRRMGKRKAEVPPWIIPNRKYHPKAYLSWLFRDPNHDRCSAYRESEHGVAALKALRWSEVLSHENYCTFARALINDLAEALGPPALPLPQGQCQKLVSRPAHVLRNI